MRRLTIAVLALLVLSPTLLAQEDPAVAEGPDLTRLRAWLASFPEDQRLDEETRGRLENDVAEAEDPLEAAVRLMRPTYAAALDVLETEGEEAALPRLEALAKNPPDAVTGAYARYRLAESLLLLDEIAAADELLGALRAERTLEGTAAERATVFLQAFSWARAGKKVEAFQLFQIYLKAWPDAPERYRALARQIVRELESEYMSPLLDLSGKMKDVARRLERLRTGDPTQEKQQEIVKLLEQLIELAEQMEKAGKGGGGGKGSSRGGRASGTQSSSPAEDSSLPTGPSSIGNLRRVSRGNPDEVWGELRDKEREEALQFLEERFPGRYRELLKEYYRSLSEGK